MSVSSRTIALLIRGRELEIEGLGEIQYSVALLTEDVILDRLLDIAQLTLTRGRTGEGRLYSEWFINPRGGFGRQPDVVFDIADYTDILVAHGAQGVKRTGGRNIVIVKNALAGATMVVTLRRRSRHPCGMNLWVQGDTSKATSGDIAYYNVFAEGVAAGTASGNWNDPDTQETLGNMAEWAAEMSRKLEQMGAPNSADLLIDEGEKAPADKPQSDWAEEMRTWGGEMKGTDNFGLTLVDVKFDQARPPAEAAHSAIEGFLEGMGQLMSGTHLAISGRKTATQTFRPLGAGRGGAAV